MDFKRGLDSVLHQLFECGAVKIDTEKGFPLRIHQDQPHLPYSPIYLNLRTEYNPKPGPLTQPLVEDMARLMAHMVRTQALEFTAIVGIPNAGDPFALALHRQFAREGKHYLYAPLEKTEIGDKRHFNVTNSALRNNPGNQKVLMVDDLITGAHSKLDVRAPLLQLGVAVDDCIVFLDREQGGCTEMAHNRCAVTAVTTITYMINRYVRHRKIPAETGDLILRYIRGEHPGVPH